MPNTIQLTKVRHYAIEDEQFEGDYYAMDLKDETGKLIAEFGDFYDDNGGAKIEGFIRGVEWATGKTVKVIDQRIADFE